jgi:hypothetical protein
MFDCLIICTVIAFALSEAVRLATARMRVADFTTVFVPNGIMPNDGHAVGRVFFRSNIGAGAGRDVKGGELLLPVGAIL